MKAGPGLRAQVLSPSIVPFRGFPHQRPRSTCVGDMSMPRQVNHQADDESIVPLDMSGDYSAFLDSHTTGQSCAVLDEDIYSNLSFSTAPESVKAAFDVSSVSQITPVPFDAGFAPNARQRHNESYHDNFSVMQQQCDEQAVSRNHIGSIDTFSESPGHASIQSGFRIWPQLQHSGTHGPDRHAYWATGRGDGAAGMPLEAALVTEQLLQLYDQAPSYDGGDSSALPLASTCNLPICPSWMPHSHAQSDYQTVSEVGSTDRYGSVIRAQQRMTHQVSSQKGRLGTHACSQW